MRLLVVLMPVRPVIGGHRGRLPTVAGGTASLMPAASPNIHMKVRRMEQDGEVEPTSEKRRSRTNRWRLRNPDGDVGRP